MSSGDASALANGNAAAIVTFCHTAVRRNRADRAALALLGAELGRAAASEVVAIAGYYPLLALFLAAADLDHPLPGKRA